MNQQDIKLTAHIDQTEVDQALGKVERINELLKEARSLVEDLASMEIKLSVNVK